MPAEMMVSGGSEAVMAGSNENAQTSSSSAGPSSSSTFSPPGPSRLPATATMTVNPNAFASYAHPHPHGGSSFNPYHINSTSTTPTIPSQAASEENDDDGIEITGSNIRAPFQYKSRAQQQHSRMGDSTAAGSDSAGADGSTSAATSNGLGASGGASKSRDGASGFSAVDMDHNGTSAASAIDLTRARLPSPPPVDRSKKTVCIGAVQSRAIGVYPSAATYAGYGPPPGTKEKFSTLALNGAELIKAKIKFRQPGQKPKPGDAWTEPPVPTLHVMTPGMSCYIGDLDPNLAEALIPLVSRGILRLEAYVQRLPPGSPTYNISLNVIFFTLPSNVDYISQHLLVNNVFLLDPVPLYDPTRHADFPEYHNAHGGHQHALTMMYAAQQRALMMTRGFSMEQNQLDKARQVEVQREQVDQVFKSMEVGGDLDMSDPGPYLKSSLYPHQRQALTFLLQREQDFVSLKRARKAQAKKEKKARQKSGDLTKDDEETTGTNGLINGEAEVAKAKAKDESRSLWEEMTTDEKGRGIAWRHAITGDEISGRKNKPIECKGAILADDMGLGKTLTIIALIAATRDEALEYSKIKLDKVKKAKADKADDSNGASAMDFKTRVFDMPDADSENGTPGPGSSSAHAKGKKRKLETVVDNMDRRASVVARSPATLLICPMSTITNWEDQIRTHWDGKVEVVGGSKGLAPPTDLVKRRKAKAGDSSDDDDDFDLETLRVYIYHGDSKRFDPRYVADFDLVITSFNTLALEFGKQTAANGDETPTTPGDTTANSDEDGVEGASGKASRQLDVKDVKEVLKKKAKAKIAKEAQPSPLQQIDWFRVVLDEAHSIKNPSTVSFMAACELEADRRIALTGTPVQNKIEDVWALFKFLRLSPIDDKDIFSKYILSKCKSGDRVGLARLQLVMKNCTLRRTKETTMENGEKLLSLPKRTEIIQWLALDERERGIYDKRVGESKEKVMELKRNGELSKNYGHVLQEILRLRQTCNHVDLVDSGVVEEDYDGTIMDWDSAVSNIDLYGFNRARAVSVMAYLKQGEENGTACMECAHDIGDWFPSVGLGGTEEDVKVEDDKAKTKKMPWKPILTKCHHVFCVKCFKKAIYPGWPTTKKKQEKVNVARACPCGKGLKLPHDVFEVLPPQYEEDEAKDEAPKKYKRPKYQRKDGEPLELSTKMKYLHTELIKNSQRNQYSVHYDPELLRQELMEAEVQEVGADSKPRVIKSVIFSQWTTMLDRIEDMLKVSQINFCRLDGTMSRDDRAQAMEDLKKPRTEVMLVSTRAGGVGLNLTAACRVFLVDPYWNPAVEAQAIDRVHRLGQKYPVQAVRLMIENSIEERLQKIQEKKANLANFALKKMTRAELLEAKADELVELFS